MARVVRWQSQGGMMLEFENPLQAIERAQLIDDHAPLKLQSRKWKSQSPLLKNQLKLLKRSRLMERHLR